MSKSLLNSYVFAGLYLVVYDTFYGPVSSGIGIQDLELVIGESYCQQKFFDAGTLSNLTISVYLNEFSGNNVFTMRVNGGDGNQTVTVSGETTGRFEDTSHTDSIDADDLVCVELVVPHEADDEIWFSYSSIFDASSNTVMMWHSVLSAMYWGM